MGEATRQFSESRAIVVRRSSSCTSSKMSLWKVFTTSQVVRQMNPAELQAGSFVWGREGFKWIADNSDKSHKETERGQFVGEQHGGFQPQKAEEAERSEAAFGKIALSPNVPC